MKTQLKKFVGSFESKFYERMVAMSVLQNEFSAVFSTPVSERREELWIRALSLLSPGRPVGYLEFGVFGGYSINFISQRHKNPKSVFVGCDSFEGLPEEWDHQRQGAFDVGGKVPQIDDTRVQFVKGWFQNTFERAVDPLSIASGDRDILIHFDADLYSSTLFVLSKLDGIAPPYLAIFDEFYGHEPRALHNYIQAFGAKIEFLGHTVKDGFPLQVLCRISPAAGGYSP